MRIRDLGSVDTEMNFDGPAPEEAWIDDGDLIVGMDGQFNAVVWSGGRALLNQRLACVRPKGVTGDFLRYVLPFPLKVIQDTKFSTTVKHLSISEIRAIRIPLPPLPTQRAIASFLDCETEKIDTLIEKKWKLLILLEEKRTALIAWTVTRGLDPDVPMKASGLEWLGKIPEHWAVRQARHLCPPSRPIIYGIVLPGPDVPEGVPLIKGGDVDRGELSSDTLNRTEYEIDKKHARSRVAAGDIVYSIRGSFGEAAIVPDSLSGANLTQDVARVSSRPSVDQRWLTYALTSAPLRASAEAGALGATIKGVNIRDLRRLRIPTPPTDEQTAIADFLDRENARIDGIKTHVTHAIFLLEEYRTALISAAVTGKVDVRDKVPA